MDNCVVDLQAVDEGPFDWQSDEVTETCLGKGYNMSTCIGRWPSLLGVDGKKDLTQRAFSQDAGLKGEWVMSLDGLHGRSKSGFFSIDIGKPAHTVEPIAQLHPSHRRTGGVVHQPEDLGPNDCYDTNNLQVFISPLAARTEPFQPGVVNRVTISPLSAIQVEMERVMVLGGELGDVPLHMKLTRFVNIGLLQDFAYRGAGLFPQLGGKSIRDRVIESTNRAVGMPVANRGRDHNLFDPMAPLIAPDASAEDKAEAAAAYMAAQQVHLLSSFLKTCISPKRVEMEDFKDDSLRMFPGQIIQLGYRGIAKAMDMFAQEQIEAEQKAAEEGGRRSLAEDGAVGMSLGDPESLKVILQATSDIAQSVNEKLSPINASRIEVLASALSPILMVLEEIDFTQGSEAILLGARVSDAGMADVDLAVGQYVSGVSSEEEFMSFTNTTAVGIAVDNMKQKVLAVLQAGEDAEANKASYPPPPPSPPRPPPKAEAFPPPSPPAPPPPHAPPPPPATGASVTTAEDSDDSATMGLAVGLPLVAVVGAALGVVLYFRRRSARAVEGDEDEFLAGGDEENAGAVSGDLLRKYNPTYNPTGQSTS